MASNDEELMEAEDLFNADDDDDMADFMNMLDSLDMEEELLPKEESVMEEFPLENEAAMEDAESVGESMEIGDLFADDETSFVAESDDDILKLLDAVGEETAAISEGMDAEEVADESVGELADILASLEDDDTEPDVMPAEPKKGIFERLLEAVKAKFHKELTEDEILLMEQEAEKERLWEEQEQLKAKEKKAEAQQKKQKKQAETEQKKQKNAETKNAKKAVKAEKKAAKKAAKAAARAEKAKNSGPIPKSQLVPVKPLVVCVILAIAFSVVFVMFTDYHYYDSSISESKENFIHQKYKEAYELLLGLDIKKKDENFFKQVTTIRLVDKELDSYYNFIKVENYEMALESLIQGVGKYDRQADNAKKLNLEKEMYVLYEELLKELTVRFGVTEQDAKNFYQMNDKEQYKKQIEEIAREAAVKDGVSEPVEAAKIQN